MQSRTFSAFARLAQMNFPAKDGKTQRRKQNSFFGSGVKLMPGEKSIFIQPRIGADRQGFDSD
jgi:hypothetical protein